MDLGELRYMAAKERYLILLEIMGRINFISVILLIQCLHIGDIFKIKHRFFIFMNQLS